MRIRIPVLGRALRVEGPWDAKGLEVQILLKLEAAVDLEGAVAHRAVLNAL